MILSPFDTHLIPVVCLDLQPDLWMSASSCFAKQDGFLLVRGCPDWHEIKSLSSKIGLVIFITTADFFEDVISQRDQNFSWVRNSRLLVVTNSTDHVTIEGYIRMGCTGVLNPEDCPALWRRAVRSVAAGEFWAPRRIVASVLRAVLSLNQGDQFRKLTPRESEVLQLIGSGYSNQDIANHLFITKETVRWHVRILYSKLGLTDRDSAIKLWRSSHSYPRSEQYLSTPPSAPGEG